MGETFTIVEHVAASEKRPERYVIRHEGNGTSVNITSHCGYTKYDNKQENRGFCPSERLPALGKPIGVCTQNSQTGPFSPPCVYRVGDYLAYHEGGTWGDDEINLVLESERTSK